MSEAFELYEPPRKRLKQEPTPDTDILLDAVEAAFSTFPTHTPTFRRLYKTLQAYDWILISNVPDNIKQLDLNWPVLIPAARCWKENESPSIQQILSYTIDHFLAEDVIIEAHDSETERHTLGNVIYQLVQPPHEKPMVAHNLPLEDNGTLDPHAIPALHLLSSLKDKDVDYSMNITPTNAIVDLHIDQGTCGLSIGIGRSSDSSTMKVHKIWFLWPPTTHNLQQYEKLRRSKGPWLERSDVLEHGVIAAMGPESGIFLPPGWIHGTVTTNGGFLCGITFDAKRAIGMASTIMAMDCRLLPTQFNRLAPVYCSALSNAFSNKPNDGCNQDAVQGWFDIEESLESIKFKVGTGHRNECRKLLDVWRQYFGGCDDEVVRQKRCERCGWKADRKTSFGKHFWEKHLKIIMTERYRSPYETTKPLGRQLHR